MVSSNGSSEARVDSDVKSNFENAKSGSNSRQRSNGIRMATGIFVWILICIPSNIVAGIFYFKQTEFKPYDHHLNSNNASFEYHGEDDARNFSTIETTVNISIFQHKFRRLYGFSCYNWEFRYKSSV